MTRRRPRAAQASAVAALLVVAPACGGDGDEGFELGSGVFPWSHLAITAVGDLEPLAEPPAAPPGEWKGELTVDACQLTGIIYGVAWLIPCEGSAAARVEACAPDPELADTERCRVTLDSLALTIRPDFEEPVIDAATVELASPVFADEAWSWSTLASPRTHATGTLTITGRSGGAPTHYELADFELRLDYVWSTYFLELRAAKPGW